MSVAIKGSASLSSDQRIPLVGFGTYLIEDGDVEECVVAALRCGYRHIDTAEGYRNESGVGRGIARGMKELGLDRSAIFVTTKVFPGNPAWGMPEKSGKDCISALESSLEKLSLDYVDLYLLHAPFGNEKRLERWRALLQLQKDGKARAVGVSNYSIDHLNEIENANLPLPAANQIELHPWCQKPKLVAHMAARSILPIAYSSLAPLSTWRTAAGQRSRKSDALNARSDASDHDDASTFAVMASKYSVTEAQLLLKWAHQQGFPVLPKSTKEERIKANAQLVGWEIDIEDMEKLRCLDRDLACAWSHGDPLRSA